MKVRNTCDVLWEFSLGIWLYVFFSICVHFVCKQIESKRTHRGTGIDRRVLIVCDT